MLDNEEKLISRAKEGDSSSFGVLYDHYLSRIYRFIYVKVASREDAEDISHQVFLNAWQNMPRYKSKGFPFSSWLYEIARNQVIDYYRTRKESVSVDDIDPDSMSEEAHGETLNTELDLERIMKKLRTMKSEYQDVLILRFVEDMSLKEVASALNKTEGAIKLIQHRAVSTLKEFFGESAKIDEKEYD
ncbi:MAG: sigma-70 family RNA polymerase sigma factor [Candidatus Omnitrophica bacterium]|nr:sigma-70 family RNA polymerase sigma factor [Candidatus Omnitrophota bacterium]